mgnify:FL=1
MCGSRRPVRDLCHLHADQKAECFIRIFCGRFFQCGFFRSCRLGIRTVDSFDYQNFTYSDGLDANGYRTGITAQDYVTLPDNVAALPIKKADVTPSDSDVQARIDSLLSQYSTTQP